MQTKWRMRLLWTGAVLILLGTFALVQTYRHSFPTQPVLVAAHNLAAGMALRPEDVKVQRVSPGTAPTGTLTKPDDLKGRWVSANLLAGDFVTAAHLASQAPKTLDQVEQGKAMVSIPVAPADILAGVLRPGDTVAIWLTDAPQGKEASARDLPGQAVVVDVRNSASEPVQVQQPTKSGSPVGGGTNANEVPAWVVIKLSEENVAPLFKAVAQKQGVHFVLLGRGEAAP